MECRRLHVTHKIPRYTYGGKDQFQHPFIRSEDWPPLVGRKVIVKTLAGSQIGTVEYKENEGAYYVKLENIANKDTRIPGAHQYHPNPGSEYIPISPSSNWTYVDERSGQMGPGMGQETIASVIETSPGVGGRTSRQNVQRAHPYAPQLSKANYKFSGLVTDPSSKAISYTPEFIEFIKESSGRYNLAFKNMEPFVDQKVDKIIERESPKHEPAPSSDLDSGKLLEALTKPKQLREKDMIVATNLQLTAESLITTEGQENREGKKIQQWAADNLTKFSEKKGDEKDLFNDLFTVRYMGYVYFIRNGTAYYDTVSLKKLTELKVENLRPLVEDKKIEVALLWTYLDNPQTSPEINKIKLEAQKIIGLENFICLQPQPRYQLFALKKLILLWYADPVLNNNIVKIKCIVNQWRCRRDIPENVKLGVLPSIVIFLRYGKEAYRQVLAKLTYYFSQFEAIGWRGNEPDYYMRHNSLIYSTNGSIEVKKRIQSYKYKGDYYSLGSTGAEAAFAAAEPGTLISQFAEEEEEEKDENEAENEEEEKPEQLPGQPQEQPLVSQNGGRRSGKKLIFKINYDY